MALILAARSYGQDEVKSYLIVVGAYSLNKAPFAERFKSSAGTEAFIVKDSERHLLLVCLRGFDQRKPSIDEMLATRRQGKYPEAWVRILKEATYAGHPEPGVEQVQEEPKVKAPTPAEPSPSQQQIATTSPVAVPAPVDTTAIRSEPVSIVIPAQQKIEKEVNASKGPPTLQNTPVVFHMYDANDNSRVIEGNIEIVDTQRARLIQTNKSTDTVSLPNPNSDSGVLSLITDVFGYRRLQHEVSYKQPIADTSKHYFDLEDDHYVARFEMVRYHKGDIATLYHVFFFNDAAIMMPESKYELNKLLDLMQSNSAYRIRLHGHTNGNGHGKIISMGPSKEFFSVNAPDVKRGSGSSKELSGQRAEVIKEWLTAQGIAADRIEVKAWGGKRMIHDKNSNNARKNVRVEVEVLSE